MADVVFPPASGADPAVGGGGVCAAGLPAGPRGCELGAAAWEAAGGPGGHAGGERALLPAPRGLRPGGPVLNCACTLSTVTVTWLLGW